MQQLRPIHYVRSDLVKCNKKKKKKNPIFILIRFHYQLFLLVSESIVFPDRLRAREDLDNTAGRQPLLKMHGLV